MARTFNKAQTLNAHTMSQRSREGDEEEMVPIKEFLQMTSDSNSKTHKSRYGPEFSNQTTTTARSPKASLISEMPFVNKRGYGDMLRKATQCKQKGKFILDLLIKYYRNCQSNQLF